MRFIRLSFQECSDRLFHMDHKLGFVLNSNAVSVDDPHAIRTQSRPLRRVNHVISQPVLKQKVFFAKGKVHLFNKDVVHKQADKLSDSHLANRRTLWNFYENLVLRLVGLDETHIRFNREKTREEPRDHVPVTLLGYHTVPHNAIKRRNINRHMRTLDTRVAYKLDTRITVTWILSGEMSSQPRCPIRVTRVITPTLGTTTVTHGMEDTTIFILLISNENSLLRFLEDFW